MAVGLQDRLGTDAPRIAHALFVAYAPYDAPRYEVSVVVEHGNAGAAMAAPIARDIMTDGLQRDPAGRSEPPTQQAAGR